MKPLTQSGITVSHKSYVSDLAFIPPTVVVDKRNPGDGKHTHLISIAEDGIVNIWDTRHVDKDTIKNSPNEINWKWSIRLDLFK